MGLHVSVTIASHDDNIEERVHLKLASGVFVKVESHAQLLPPSYDTCIPKTFTVRTRGSYKVGFDYLR